MPLQLDDLAALDAPAQANNGQPLLLPVGSIDEDPEQPRREFEDHRLDDLAATIRARGVRQPISVRPQLQAPGRWILNFGARRLRASKLAGLAEIPAFVDTTADSYDQVIENEQREGLRPLELALFVQKRLALGDSQAEIARRLGKSRQWVTLATALIDPPEWLLLAYRQGRCRGLNELYDLRRLQAEHGDAVETWVGQQSSITRDRLTDLRAALERGTAPAPAPAGRVEESPDQASAAADPAAVTANLRRASSAQGSTAVPRTATLCSGPAETSARSGPRIRVEFEGRDCQLLVSVVPEVAGCMYVRPLAGGPRRLAPVAALKLLGFLGG